MKNILLVEICFSNGEVEHFETLFRPEDQGVDNFESACNWFNLSVSYNLSSKFIYLKQCTNLVMINVDHIMKYKLFYERPSIYEVIEDGKSFEMKVLMNSSLAFNIYMYEFDEKLKETAEQYSYDLIGRSENIPFEDFKRLIYRHLKKEYC